MKRASCRVKSESCRAEKKHPHFPITLAYRKCKKIEGGFNENKLEKSSIEKTPDFFKKKQNSDKACWASENLILRRKLFLLKNLTMPKTVKGGPLKVFNIHAVAKFQKIEGESFNGSLIVPKI